MHQLHLRFAHTGRQQPYHARRCMPRSSNDNSFSHGRSSDRAACRVLSLSLHRVRGIGYRQNWNSSARLQLKTFDNSAYTSHWLRCLAILSEAPCCYCTVCCYCLYTNASKWVKIMLWSLVLGSARVGPHIDANSSSLSAQRFCAPSYARFL